MQHRAQTEIASPINRKSQRTESLFISGIRSSNVHKLLNMNTLPIIKESSVRINFFSFIFYNTVPITVTIVPVLVTSIDMLSEFWPAVYPACNLPAEKLVLGPAGYPFRIATGYLFYIVGCPCQLIQKTHKFRHRSTLLRLL